MIKKIVLGTGMIFSSFLLFAVVCRGQQDTLDIKDIHSTYAVARLYDMSKYVRLSPQRLKVLARYFADCDSIASRDLAEGKSLESIHLLYELAEKNLSDILNADEYAQYINGTTGTPSVVGTAFKLSSKIYLKPAQRDSLIAGITRYRLSPEKENFTDFDAQLAKKILLKEQLQYCVWYAYEKTADKETDREIKTYTELGIHRYAQPAGIARKFIKGYLLQRRTDDWTVINNNRIRDSISIVRMALRPKAMMLLQAFTASPDLPASFLSTAIQYREIMGLNEAQIRKICDELENRERRRCFYLLERREGELEDSKEQAEMLSAILGPNGYQKLLQVKGLRYARSAATKAWGILKDKGFSGSWDSTKAVTEMEHYYLERSVAADRVRSAGRTEAIDSVLVAYELQLPDCLLLSNALAGSLPSSPMSDLLANCVTIGLSKEQTLGINRLYNQLLSRKRLWVSQFGGLRFDTEVVEGQEIEKSLPPGLYASFLSFRATKQATLLTQSYIDRMAAMFLIGAVDNMQKMSDEIYHYAVHKLEDETRAIYGGNSLIIDSVRDHYLNSRPWPLLKLDAYEGILPWCEFTEAFMLRGKLWLAPSQIDTLIWFASQFGQKLRGNRMGATLSPVEDLHAFELANMPRVLNTYQTERYLYLKYYKIAEGISRDVVAKLQEENLAVPDSILSKKIFNYQLSLLMANEREEYYHDQITAAKKAAAESLKPEEWARYEDIMRNAEAKRAAKRNLTW